MSRRRMLAVSGTAVAGLTLAGRVAPAQADCFPNYSTCPDPSGSHCCPPGSACCNSTVAYPAEPCCNTNPNNGAVTECCRGFCCCPSGKDCCYAYDSTGFKCHCCDPGQTCDALNATCGPSCPPAQVCGSNCCTTDQQCVNGQCCPSAQVCGSTCCASGQMCVDGQCCASDSSVCQDSSGKGHCCPSNQPCCPLPDGSTTCCPTGTTCVKEILPGQGGITAGSPNTCCPPDRLVTATSTPICCPPGSVHQPGNVLNARGGLCCTAANVCGDDCCDGLPSFPMKCVSGGCQFILAKIKGTKAQASSDGTVAVQMTTTGSASGELTLQTPVAGAAALASAAAKPQILGRARFRVSRRGRHTIKVHLNARGRLLLHRHKTLRAQAVITFSRVGKSVSSTATLTILAAHRRRR